MSVLCDLEPKGGMLRCKNCRRLFDPPRVPPLHVMCVAPGGVPLPAKAKGGCGGKEEAEMDAKGKYQDPPTFLAMAAGFAKSMKDFAAGGFRLCGREQYDARMEVCSACDHRVGRRCGLCGCLVAIKGKSPDWQCPDDPKPLGRWKEIDEKFQGGKNGSPSGQ